MAPHPTFALAPMLEKDKLTATGGNFTDWYRNLRIVLKSAKKEYILEKTLGDAPPDSATAKCGIQKDANHVMMVNKTQSFKKKGKAKQKGKSKGAGKTGANGKPKSGASSDTECFFCKEKGHWKRNCKKYLAEKKKTGKSSSGMSVIHVIDVFLAGPHCKSWVLDTGSVAHICNSMQDLRRPRRLAKDEVLMRVGNGVKVAVKAVGVLPLHLPSGFILELSNCYYVPALCKNIISGSCLLQDGYSFKSVNNGCSIFMNNIFYGNAPIVNGLFILNLESDAHIFNTDAKRLKTDKTNTTFLWHCRLGHIGKKRRNFTVMEFWSHLILNHLTLANLV